MALLLRLPTTDFSPLVLIPSLFVFSTKFAHRLRNHERPTFPRLERDTLRRSGFLLALFFSASAEKLDKGLGAETVRCSEDFLSWLQVLNV